MKNLLTIIGLLFILFLVYAMTIPGATLADTRQAQQQSQRQLDTTFTVLGAPSLPAKFIDQVLCFSSRADTPHVSPACGTGQALYNYGVQYGIDPAYALAWFQHESSFGRYGIAASNLGLGNIRCTPGYICKSGFRAYGSWPEGYADWYRLITSFYVKQLHLTTVMQIVPTYAPASENDVQGYIRAITRAVLAWRSEVQS